MDYIYHDLLNYVEINTENVLNEDELKKTSPFYVVNNRIMNIGIIGKGFVGSAV